MSSPTEFFGAFCPKQLTAIHTNIHTLMAVAAMQGADQHIRSSLGFSILPKDTSCRPGWSNQRPSDNKTQALPLSHSRPQNTTPEIPQQSSFPLFCDITLRQTWCMPGTFPSLLGYLLVGLSYLLNKVAPLIQLQICLIYCNFFTIKPPVI